MVVRPLLASRAARMLGVPSLDDGAANPESDVACGARHHGARVMRARGATLLAGRGETSDRDWACTSWIRGARARPGAQRVVQQGRFAATRHRTTSTDDIDVSQ